MVAPVSESKLYQPRLSIVPMTWKAANAYVKEHHRHHGTVAGCKFALGVIDENKQLRGVALCGRPVARMLDDGLTLEVNRVATDGCPNACSALYGAARRVAKAMGYKRAITYILAEEPGTSLRGAGWVPVETRTAYDRIGQGGTWSREGREREDKHPLGKKTRWEVLL
jgi:hypothetical protein